MTGLQHQASFPGDFSIGDPIACRWFSFFLVSYFVFVSWRLGEEERLSEVYTVRTNS